MMYQERQVFLNISSQHVPSYINIYIYRLYMFKNSLKNVNHIIMICYNFDNFHTKVSYFDDLCNLFCSIGSVHPWKCCAKLCCVHVTCYIYSSVVFQPSEARLKSTFVKKWSLVIHLACCVFKLQFRFLNIVNNLSKLKQLHICMPQ